MVDTKSPRIIFKLLERSLLWTKGIEPCLPSAVQEANVPTIVDHLIALAQEYFARPDVAARIKPLENALEKTLSSPSPGYEPWLVEHGYSPIIARLTAALVVRRGNRIAKENVRLPEAVDAIRFLAKPGRKKQVIARKVAVLLAAWEETSAMDTIFRDTNLDVFEFVRLLVSAAKGGDLAYSRLTEFATALAPHLAIPRGPKISAESAAHEFFLEEAVIPMERRAYTWDDLKENFTDPATEATRREFASLDFDPRPARRRLKAQNKRN